MFKFSILEKKILAKLFSFSFYLSLPIYNYFARRSDVYHYTNINYNDNNINGDDDVYVTRTVNSFAFDNDIFVKMVLLAL